jgi:hypothetical protein
METLENNLDYLENLRKKPTYDQRIILFLKILELVYCLKFYFSYFHHHLLKYGFCVSAPANSNSNIDD